MISGKIIAGNTAVIELEIVGLNQQEKVEATIDTGFTGYLTLPRRSIESLKLRRIGSRYTILGDGNAVFLSVYRVKVLWHGTTRSVSVLQTNGEPLIGMSLLYGSRLILDVITDGEVTIEALPNQH